jgi:hypothetical protein
MVIVPIAFMASAPQGMLATSLNPQTRHFNLAETRHLNFGLTPKMLIINVMSNQLFDVLKQDAQMTRLTPRMAMPAVILATPLFIFSVNAESSDVR